MRLSDVNAPLCHVTDLSVFNPSDADEIHEGMTMSVGLCLLPMVQASVN